MADEDFEFQLQAQKQFAVADEEKTLSTAATYVDPQDSTVYEWDEEKQGWFPKVLTYFSKSIL